MPHRYIIAGDEIAPYMVVMNSHDGSSGIKVAMTPIRVVCQNTLNLALNSAKRVWTTKHTENVMSRVHEARETLMLAEIYMGELGKGIDALSRIKLTDRKVMEFMNEFFPVDSDIYVQRGDMFNSSKTGLAKNQNQAALISWLEFVLPQVSQRHGKILVVTYKKYAKTLWHSLQAWHHRCAPTE